LPHFTVFLKPQHLSQINKSPFFAIAATVYWFRSFPLVNATQPLGPSLVPPPASIRYPFGCQVDPISNPLHLGPGELLVAGVQDVRGMWLAPKNRFCHRELVLRPESGTLLIPLGVVDISNGLDFVRWRPGSVEKSSVSPSGHWRIDIVSFRVRAVAKASSRDCCTTCNIVDVWEARNVRYKRLGR